MSKQNTAPFPEKPRLTLQVGVTGHRPCRLPVESDYLKARVAETLQTIALAYREFATTANAQIAYNTNSPALRLLSPLAEGADRIAAVAGLAAGYELQCPLPFLRDLYAEDFAETSGSLDKFDQLLGKASKILELDGKRNNKSQAYRNVGNSVLNHSDLVLAIWDGEENPQSPGTPGMVAEARRIGLPIIWVNTVRTSGKMGKLLEKSFSTAQKHLRNVLHPFRPKTEFNRHGLSWIFCAARQDRLATL